MTDDNSLNMSQHYITAILGTVESSMIMHLASLLTHSPV